MAAAAKCGKEGVTDCAISGIAAIGLNVANISFDGAAAPQIGDQF